MNSRLTLVLVTTLLTLSQLTSQTIHPDYWDGRVYFKLKDDCNLVIEDLAALRSKAELSQFADAILPHAPQKLQRTFLVVNTPVFDRTYEVYFDKHDSVERMMDDLQSINVVEYAEQVPLDRSDLVPNDPNVPNQYALPLINAYDAWDLHTGGNAVVAVIDDAVDVSHPDLIGNIWQNPGEIPGNFIDDDGNGFADDINGWDAADNDNTPQPPPSATNAFFSHGTHVAGIAGATTNNGIGVASIGFNTKIMAIKVKSNADTDAGLPFVYSGFAYALTVAPDVINMSLGGGGYSQTNQNLMNQAHALGITVLASAGNDNENAPHYPSDYNHVISVASTTSNDTKSGFSNYSNSVDISAPGSGIYSTLVDDNNPYGNNSGTSMSCPMVAGLAALMKSYNPVLTPDQIENCLKNTAVNINALNPGFGGLLGAGRIDAFAALQCANPNAAPVVLVGDDAEDAVCAGTAIQFFDQSLYSPTQWQWSFPGGTPSSSTEQNPIVTYNVPGTYDVTLTVSNDFGSNTETIINMVEIDNASDEVLLFSTFENGLVGWEVENPDGAITWEAIAVQGSERVGTRSAYVNGFNYEAVGARDAMISPAFSLLDRPQAVLEVDYFYRPQINNVSDSLIIYVTVDDGETYTRIFADAEDVTTGEKNFATGNQINGNVIPINENNWCFGQSSTVDCITLDLNAFIGEPSVRLKFEFYSNSGNNLFIDNVIVRSVCLPVTAAPQAQFDATQKVGCDSLLTTFIDQSGGVVDNRQWTFVGGNPATSTEKSPTVTYSSPGLYEVVLEVTNANGTSSLVKSEYINITTTEPNAAFDFTRVGTTLTFENLSTDAATYSWNFGDGTTSAVENPIHTFTDEGNYFVTLSAFNGCGEDTVTTSVIASSINEVPDFLESLNVFPNPTTGQFSIRANGDLDGQVDIEIYGIDGRRVATRQATAFGGRLEATFDLLQASPGQYLVILRSAQGTAYRKLIKQ